MTACLVAGVGGWGLQAAAQAVSQSGAAEKTTTVSNKTISSSAGSGVVATAGLPDSPSALMNVGEEDGILYSQTANDGGQTLPPCPKKPAPLAPGATRPPCAQENPFRSVVNSNTMHPLTSEEKGFLAIRDFLDPFSLIVLTAQAGIGVAANSHSPYGPGMKGFGRLTGYSLLGDATGTFFGTYAIPSLVHEDPRYRRMQNASIPRRVLHAVSRTVIAEHDDGQKMPNYATLLTYPITAELSNLYVPGGQVNAPDTAKRIAFGYMTDPIGNLIAEFLPDIARHIHFRSVFIQQFINQVALSGNTSPVF